MAEPTLTLGYDDFAGETGYYLGWGRDKTVWDASQTADLAVIVNAGMRTFLNPPSLAENEPPHIWSFLFEAATVSLTSADFDYDLPENFGGGVQWFTYAASVVKKTIEIVPYDQLLALRANNNASGDPTIAAIHRKTFSATTGERYEAVFYPTPNASRTITYTFLIRPAKLDTTNKYAYGSANHSETILAACLAIAEMRRNDGQKGPLWEHWVECLKTSIQRDKVNMPITRAFPWSQTEPSDLQATYQALQYILGDYLGFGPDPATWKTPEVHKAHTAIQNGLRRFYFPEVEGKGRYLWTFMNPVSEFQLISGQSTYSMPADYAGINAPFTFQTEESENAIPWDPSDPVPYQAGTNLITNPDFDISQPLQDFWTASVSPSGKWDPYGPYYAELTAVAGQSRLGVIFQRVFELVGAAPPHDETVIHMGRLYLFDFRVLAVGEGGVRMAIGWCWNQASPYYVGSDWDSVGNGTIRIKSGFYKEIIPSSALATTNVANIAVSFLGTGLASAAVIANPTLREIMNPEDIIVLGDECVQNADFLSDDGWTLGTGWTYAGDSFDHEDVGGLYDSDLKQLVADQTIALEKGIDKLYRVSIDVTLVSGELTVYLNDPDADPGDYLGWYGESPVWYESDAISETGVHIRYAGQNHAAETFDIVIRPINFVGSVNSISIKQIIAFRSEVV